MKAPIQLLFIITSLGSFLHAKPETDSCTSNLSLKVPLPFDTANLHCLSVWDAQGFILRVSAPFQNFLHIYIPIPIAYPNHYVYYFAVCSDFCKHLELYSLNTRHKFLHSYGVFGQRQHGGFKCDCRVGGI